MALVDLRHAALPDEMADFVLAEHSAGPGANFH